VGVGLISAINGRASLRDNKQTNKPFKLYPIIEFLKNLCEFVDVGTVDKEKNPYVFEKSLRI
jgi:hypothetical protein